MTIKLLVVTANEHETRALRELEHFENQEVIQSSDPHDPAFYTKGNIGCHEIIHLELLEQGSSRADSSLAALLVAITEWKPEAVILLGIAFGKDDGAHNDSGQKIGDVLVSTKVADYESGKLKDGSFQSDGVIAEAGRVLLSNFRHYSSEWEYSTKYGKSTPHFGVVLSGDKLVDDPAFKAELFERYPRAIGGEMEGRGAYAACRRRDLPEWIIIKAICDWGVDKDSPTKEEDQKIASAAAAALFEHVTLSPGAFSKLEQVVPQQASNLDSIKTIPEVIGYIIYVGTTSSRLFEVRNDHTLKEKYISSYEIVDTKDPRYLEGITQHVKMKVLPQMDDAISIKLQKVFVDAGFDLVFENDQEPTMKRDFIRSFYQETGLYFNLLSKAQTEDNLRRLFRENLEDDTAIISVGSQGVDILLYADGEFDSRYINVSLKMIEDYAASQNLPRKWDEQHVRCLKEYVRGRIGRQLEGWSAKNAILIKGELTFMRDTGYSLRVRRGRLGLSQRQYAKDNRRFLFCVDYNADLVSQYPTVDSGKLRRLFGFRFGHVLIETILEMLDNKFVIPSDDLTIHGSPINAYVFNVVISGSTHDGRDKHMVTAHRLLSSLGANVLSPQIRGEELRTPVGAESEYEHLRAIDECDVLFISNADDGYVGASAKRELYYAYALMKTIAFWMPPPSDDCLRFIPYEDWSIIEEL